MKKILLSICLTLVMLLSSVTAYGMAAGSPVIEQNKTLDILITADDTYTGDVSDFATQLSGQLDAKGLTTADNLRINTVNTDISLSNFDSWYVYDHYYHKNYPVDGSAPANWNSYSGRHPYFYYKEANPSTEGIPQEQLDAAEVALHDELWKDYQIYVYSCRKIMDDNNDNGAGEDKGNDIPDIYELAAASKPYSTLSAADKAAVDAQIVKGINKESGMSFTNINDLITYARDMFAQEYGKTYNELSNDEKKVVDDAINNQLITPYYSQAAFGLLDDVSQKALIDKYLMDNYVKPDAALSENEKAELLKTFKNNYYDSLFSAYLEGLSFTNDSLTTEKKAEILSDYYYDSYIDNGDAADKIEQYAVNYIYYTDITSPGSIDAIHYRDKHIYTSIDNDKASMTFLGYSAPAYKDFLIYPTTMENEKKVMFDIDASKVNTHTLEGAGFLVNSGIDNSGYIHGYILFYQFTSNNQGKVKLLKIKDNVLAEALHNCSNGYLADFNDYGEVYYSTYTTEIASQDFLFTSSNKKMVSLSIKPNSLTCEETDYTTADTLGTANELFIGYDPGLFKETGYNGFGPIASYTSHGCEQISIFTFTNLKMSYESSPADSLRSATYVNNAKKLYVVLTGSPETDVHTDLNAYDELLTRLGQDQIFYVTNGGSYTINDINHNGLYLDDSNTLIADTANYIASIASGDTLWANTSLPSGDGLLPVAIFDIDDQTGNQVMAVDRNYIADSGLTLMFGNLNKSAALATSADSLTYTYKVYDPSGNAITLGGNDNNELTLNSLADLGAYTFALKVSEGGRTSVTATRTLNVTTTGMTNDQIIAAAKAAITAAGLTMVQGTDSNVLTRIQAILTGAGIKGITVGLASSNNSQVASDGSVTYGSTQVTGNVTFTLTCGSTKDSVVLSVVVPGPTGNGGGHNNNNNNNQPPTSANVLVNGKSESAGTVSTTKEGDRTATTITVDPQKLTEKLANEGNKAVVTIPVSGNSDIVIGQLTGDMVKGMETKQAVLEIKTDSASYKLPAEQIKITDVAAQLGTSIDLKDVKVQVEIAKPTQSVVKVVEDAANKGNFSIVVPPVEFTVTCTYNNKTVSVSSFNNYVERSIAIPDGVDPNKITTGVVTEPDGTVRHVPTRITQTNGKYYAVINSLTNSTYSVVWHPLEFKDVASHWAKKDVNDMGSRMVISGVGDNKFDPDRDITRAEFAAIMVRALGLKPGVGNNPFKDVKASDWYYDFVKTAFDYKIIAGYNEKAFGPNDKITREQAMTMIARAMAITNLKASDVSNPLAQFGDAGKTSAWAKSGVASCVQAGIITGKNGNLIDPQANITRAEVAASVRRLLQKSQLI